MDLDEGRHDGRTNAHAHATHTHTHTAAAKQKRIGESKVIAAHAEVAAAKLMREAADILNSPAAMQIRYLETLQTMSQQAGTKVIFLPSASGGGGAGKMSAKDSFIYEKMSE
jgi:erythrocyte band 7 integral membrane protein